MGKEKSTSISFPKKILRIIDELVKEGDYHSRSDFVREASRSHLETWYFKKLHPEE